MKKFINHVFQRPIFVMFCLILVIFLPSALFREPDSTRRLIVTALAVDMVDDEIEISALSFIPVSSTTYQENYKVFSAKGSSVSEAISKIGLYVGKTVALTHTAVVIVNQELASNGIVKYIDHLARSNDISNKTALLCTEKSAKNLLQKLNELDSSSDLSVRDLVAFNTNNIYSKTSNIGSFYRGYFSPSKVSMIGYLKLAEEEGIETNDNSGSGIQGGSGSQGGGGAQGGGGNQGGSGTKGGDSSQGGGASQNGQVQPNNKILNDGSACVFKKGEFITILSPEQVYQYNWINSSQYKNLFQLFNVTDGVFKNANLTYRIQEKKEKSQVSMKNGRPVYDNFLFLSMELEEVEQDNLKNNELLLYKNYFSEKVKLLAQNKIRGDFAKILNLARELKIDIFGIYDMFDSQHEKEFKEFLKTIEDSDNYLSYVDINLYIEFLIVS